MKNVNIAELKNKLSAFLNEVEQGEEIIVQNRKKAVARIVAMRSSQITDEERELVGQGKLRLPEAPMSRKFLDRFLAQKMPKVSGGSSVEALSKDRDDGTAH